MTEQTEHSELPERLFQAGADRILQQLDAAARGELDETSRKRLEGLITLSDEEMEVGIALLENLKRNEESRQQQAEIMAKVQQIGERLTEIFGRLSATVERQGERLAALERLTGKPDDGSEKEASR